ncbi:marvel domain-containing protein [Corynascus novoguineensis]|uniref:Marvel domain-containing protein n=1 Tax=Corynascus novoguineensis TaxID=1126955 RepID=A0AAN7HP30_9PEZI|nr:marvel domain-containing protein [Corynascus novoguineensis]
MLRPIYLGLRGLMFLSSLTILALAAVMIKNQVYDAAPATTRYSTFTGGFGMIVGGIGAICAFISFVPDLVPIALDGLAGLFFLGGGIAWAYGLKNTSNCSDYRNMLENSLLNQGSITLPDGKAYGVIKPDDSNDDVAHRLKGNCQRAQADEILQFLCFGMAFVLVALGFFQMRRGGVGKGRTGAYVA